MNFDLSGFKFIYQTKEGSTACALIDFFYDVRKLPLLQLKDDEKRVTSEEDEEFIAEKYYSTKFIADDFLLVAPILLYRVIESALKEYLRILDKSKLIDKNAIMTADIERLKSLYKKSPAKVDLTTISCYDIIEELRLLNNSLKHNNDLVSNELHEKNKYWGIGDLITVQKIEGRISCFEHGIMSFFCELEKKIKQK